MKTLIIIIACIPILAMASCSLDKNDVEIVDNTGLSHLPDGKITVSIHDMNVSVDFGYDDYLKDYIASEYGEDKITLLNTRVKLINYYNGLPPIFNYSYSSFRTDHEIVFMKLEYLLAQEVFQKDCSSETRKKVLEMAIEKQKHKFEEYRSSFDTRLTGAFLIAVILLMEQDPAFIKALEKDTDMQGALCLNQHIRTDKEFSERLIQFAEDYLCND